MATLNIVSIGLNLPPVSVEVDYYFADPRNRFWKTLNLDSTKLLGGLLCTTLLL